METILNFEVFNALLKDGVITLEEYKGSVDGALYFLHVLSKYIEKQGDSFNPVDFFGEEYLLKEPAECEKFGIIDLPTEQIQKIIALDT